MLNHLVYDGRVEAVDREFGVIGAGALGVDDAGDIRGDYALGVDGAPPSRHL
jgi:hypothetical protein